MKKKMYDKSKNYKDGGVLFRFSSHLFQNENIAKTNVPEFEIAGYKQSSKHVHSTETTKCYLFQFYFIPLTSCKIW